MIQIEDFGICKAFYPAVAMTPPPQAEMQNLENICKVVYSWKLSRTSSFGVEKKMNMKRS